MNRSPLLPYAHEFGLDLRKPADFAKYQQFVLRGNGHLPGVRNFYKKFS